MNWCSDLRSPPPQADFFYAVVASAGLDVLTFQNGLLSKASSQLANSMGSEPLAELSSLYN